MSVILSGCFATEVWNSWFPDDTTENVVIEEDNQVEEGILLPDRFVEFNDTNLGVSFAYPAEWGTVKINKPIEDNESVTELTFETAEDVVQDTTESDRQIAGRFLPVLTFVSRDQDPATSVIPLNFINSPTEDCIFFQQENQKIVDTFNQRNNKDEKLAQLLIDNKFDCFTAPLLQTESLITFNPIQLQQPTNDQKAEPNPIPVPLMEYRLALGDNFVQQTVLASMFIFSDEVGTTYQDFLNGGLDLIRKEAIADFMMMMSTLVIDSAGGNLIDEVLKNEIPTDNPAEPKTTKRKRPTTSFLKTYLDHDLVSFQLPNDWVVTKQVDNVLLIGTKERLTENRIPELRIKFLDNPQQKKLDDFLKNNKQVLLDSTEKTTEETYNGITWKVFKNFQGIVKLDIYFAVVGDKVIEINSLAAGETGFDPMINTVVASIRLK